MGWLTPDADAAGSSGNGAMALRSRMASRRGASLQH
jgi:hypothetical protein